MKRRILFFAMLGVGLLGWKGGFGFLATERTITFHLPVQASDVRRVELQVWDEGSLLTRRVEEAPTGLGQDPTLRLPLERGPHRAIAAVWLSKEAQSRTFQTDFDPQGDDEVALHFAR